MKLGRWVGKIGILCTILLGAFTGCGTEEKEQITSVAQLNQSQYTIGVHPGSAAAILAEEQFPNAKLVYHNEISDAYLSVERGKTDALIYSKMFMQYAVASEALDNLAIMSDTLSEADVAVGINPKRADLLPEVNAFIEQLKEDGTLEDMYHRWVEQANSVMPELPKAEAPSRVLKIGTSGLVEPMNYYDENQNLTGMDLEFIYRLAAYMNAEVQIEAMSFDALVASLESGKLDMVVSDLNVTEERKEVILMSEPYMTSEIGVLVRKDRLGVSKSQYESLDDLDGQVLGLLDGCSFDSAVVERFPNATLLYYMSYSDCIAALKNGKIDAYITDNALIKTQMNEVDGLTYFPEVLRQEDYAFMLGKENTALLQELNTTLAEMEAEGVQEALQEKWLNGTGAKSIEYDPDVDTSKGVLKVITSADVEPFAYVGDGGVLGYEAELLVKAAERMGYEVEYQTAEFSALIPAVVSEKADIAFGCLTITDERKESVNFSDTTYTSGPIAVIQSGEEGETSFLERMQASFTRTFIKENRWTLLRDGMIVTLKLSVISLILGTLLGFFVSFPLRSKHPLVHRISHGISTFLDGMPLVVILMVLYYIVFKNIDISAMWVGIVGFTLDFANVVAALLNTGVAGVDKGQLEAAESMGYSKRQIFCKITMPQAAKQMFAQYEGAVIGLVKGTAIIGYITVEDLTKAGDIIRSRTYEAFFPLIVIAILYFLLAHVFVVALKRVHIKLDPKRRPRRIKGVQSSDND